jgi:hypothetical protein
LNHYRHLHTDLAPAPATVVARLKLRSRFFRVLKDAFHGLRIRVSLKHGAQLHFSNAMSRAFFVPNQDDLKAILQVCERKNQDLASLTDEYLSSHVRKLIPDPETLYTRVSATLQSFYEVRDEKTNKLLLTEDVKELCDSLLQHVKKGLLCSCDAVQSLFHASRVFAGCFSDPVGIPLYQVMFTDSDGLPVYKCARGTNNCENIHAHLISLFRGSNVGVPMVDAVLRKYRYEKNIRAGVANRGEFDYGTYDYSLLHQINELAADIFGKLDYPRLTNPGWFKSSGEEFGFAKLPACFDIYSPLHLTSTPSPLSSAGFLAKRLGWNAVPNDVRTHEERKLFMTEFPKFKLGDKGLDSDAMALAWSKSVDGVTVFPKLPNHLEKHKTVYEKARNRDSTIASMAEKLLDLHNMLSVSFLPSRAHDEDTWLLSRPSPLKPLEIDDDSVVPFPVSPKKLFHSVEQPTPPRTRSDREVKTSLVQTASTRRARRCKLCALETCPGAHNKDRCTTAIDLRRQFVARPRTDRSRLDQGQKSSSTSSSS